VSNFFPSSGDHFWHAILDYRAAAAPPIDLGRDTWTNGDSSHISVFQQGAGRSPDRRGGAGLATTQAKSDRHAALARAARGPLPTQPMRLAKYQAIGLERSQSEWVPNDQRPAC